MSKAPSFVGYVVVISVTLLLVDVQALNPMNEYPDDFKKAIGPFVRRERAAHFLDRVRGEVEESRRERNTEAVEEVGRRFEGVGFGK